MRVYLWIRDTKGREDGCADIAPTKTKKGTGDGSKSEEDEQKRRAVSGWTFTSSSDGAGG